jgi:hypothetical protein
LLFEKEILHFVQDDKESENVILQPAKNFMFFFSSQKIKREDPSDLRPQDDG